MKSINEMYNELREAAISKIEKSEYTVTKYGPSKNKSYLCEIEIKVDGIPFHFSLHESREFVTEHSTFIRFFHYGQDKGRLKSLYDYHDKQSGNCVRRIAELEAQLEKMKAEHENA